MKKFVVAIALLILILGVTCFLISETRFEEETIDEWVLNPPTLYPYWRGVNESDYTGCYFIDRAKGNNETFRQLFDQGKISELFLKLNVTASSLVRVSVGKFLFFNETTGKTTFSNIIFNKTGTYIDEIVKVDVTNKSANANYLEIRNEGVNPVSISGCTILKGKIPKVFYPFYGFGILMCLLGFSLVFYGLLAKPKRKRTLARAQTASLKYASTSLVGTLSGLIASLILRKSAFRLR